MNTTNIQIYAPTSTADEENVEEFYGKLQELAKQVLKRRCFNYYGEAGAPGITGKQELGIQNKSGK